jgi:hypothetical protein
MDGNKSKDPVRRFSVAIYTPVCKVIAFDDPADFLKARFP